MRARCLSLLIALMVCACNEEPRDPSGDASHTVKVPVKNPNPASPATGLPRIQEMHDMWARIVTAEEKKGKGKAHPATVKQALRGCDIMINALERSIKEDAKFSAQVKYANMRGDLARLRRQFDVLLRERDEIDTILKEAASGAAPIPSGFTRAELQDNLADIKEAMRKHNGKTRSHLDSMVELEKAMQSGQPEKPEVTLASRELEAVKALKKRAEALH